MKKDNSNQIDLPIGKIIFFTILGILLITVLFGSFFRVQSGQEAVLLTWGKASEQSIGAGLHFKIPIAQDVVKFDVKTSKYETDAAAASKDLQDVATTITVNYHLESKSVPTIYSQIGIDYETKLIQPMVQDSVKAVTAQFTAEQLITQRSSVSSQILSGLRERLNQRGILVEEISITNFEFSQVFSQAIETKVTAEQNALAEQNKLKQIEFQAQQRVAQANGEREATIALAEGQAQATKLNAEAEAEKIRLQNQELAKSPQYVELIKWQQWNGQLPQWYMVGDSGAQLLVQTPIPTE